ncbi:MAG: MarR family transcriptional regulator [Clostridia bacterium]
MSKLLCEYFIRLYKKNMNFLCEKATEQLPVGQVLCLHEIYNNEGLSQEKLATELLVDKGTIARAIQKMIDKDLIYRERSLTDKRAYGIYLTKKGKEEFAKIFLIYTELENKMSENLTDVEKIALLHLLEKVYSYS